MSLEVAPVRGEGDRRAFVELLWRVYARDPHWVPPLRRDALALIGGPRRNPYYGHADVQPFLAWRGGRVVGRIAAHVDQLVLERRPGLGLWGLFEVEGEDAEAAAALIAAAEAWLRERGLTRAQGPFSLSIWDEPGLLVDGFDRPPTVMMGHHRPAYARWIEAAGYRGVKDLHAWELDIARPFPELVQRIVAAGERNPRIRIREADPRRLGEEARLVLGILNEAWSNNWGFVPLTDAEIAHAAAKLKPVLFPDLVRIALYDGEPVAFMLTLPDVNELTRDLNGRLFPVGWAKLWWRLRRPRVTRMRVPLMGVRRQFQGTRMASLLAFMMIEFTRRAAVAHYGATRAEIGWILEDNGPMRSIARAIEARITRTYRIFERDLQESSSTTQTGT
ncbi:MAG: N-acetyltransferase [Sphingomonadaceae bacterium]|uniref:N-acetyltransferase n=1 Tax=Thermaurantiacus sp. TaxID=2820283 RepID=UPI00298EFAF7|nr:N-acetyltransferase [Thermaurantiacus sp.]MCS6986700.1 N-acetyltransferase [Sphingomonadaceae bacterium]MDW8414037.1 N-acetyltransferase [Thermaurantiacus sp.]